MKWLKKFWLWLKSFFTKRILNAVPAPVLTLFSIGEKIHDTPVKRHAWFKTSDGRRVRKPI